MTPLHQPAKTSQSRISTRPASGKMLNKFAVWVCLLTSLLSRLTSAGKTFTALSMVVTSVTPSNAPQSGSRLRYAPLGGSPAAGQHGGSGGSSDDRRSRPLTSDSAANVFDNLPAPTTTIMPPQSDDGRPPPAGRHAATIDINGPSVILRVRRHSTSPAGHGVMTIMITAEQDGDGGGRSTVRRSRLLASGSAAPVLSNLL